MNWADLAILGLIGLSTAVSLLRGFVKEALSLASWIIAFVVARLYHAELAALLPDVIATPSLRLLAGFVLLFIATLLVCSLLSVLLASLVKVTGLTGTDRILGMVFGLFRGVVLVVVAVALMKLTPLTADPWWQESSLLPHFQDLESWSRKVFGDPLAYLPGSA